MHAQHIGVLDGKESKVNRSSLKKYLLVTDKFNKKKSLNYVTLRYAVELRMVEEIVGLHKLLLNPLNPELNPICYLLALLGAHHFLHVSRIRVKF